MALRRTGLKSPRPSSIGGRASGTLVTARHLFIQQRCSRRIAAPRRHPDHPENPDPGMERDRHHVSAFDHAAGRRHPDAVDPDMPGDDQAGRSRTGADDARIPQPPVNPLPVVGHLAAGHFAPTQRRSLAAASSCALSAASLANGELGSACFSRSR